MIFPYIITNKGMQDLQMQVKKDVVNCLSQKQNEIMQKLETRSYDFFRDANIHKFDLNQFSNVKELDHVDTLVSPLVYCCYYGLKQIAKFILISKSLDIDLETPQTKQTPLTVACKRGNYQMVRMLVLSKAEINKPNGMTQSPLSVVFLRLANEPVSFENTCICFMIAEFLINHGADPNWIVDKVKGYSLLHYFCSVRGLVHQDEKDLHFRIVKFLVDKGANVKQRTLLDETVRELARGHCNADKLLALFDQMTPLPRKIPQNFKRLGENYFRICCTQENS